MLEVFVETENTYIICLDYTKSKKKKFFKYKHDLVHARTVWTEQARTDRDKQTFFAFCNYVTPL